MENIVIVLFSAVLLFWQLFVLFACCSGFGLALRFLLPKEFSLLNKVFFSLIGGLFLVVLIPQNLVYLGVPVRISAWLILSAALVQIWWCRRNFFARIRAFYSNAELRTLAIVTLLTITFHGGVPVQQGLEWYYGKGHDDQLNYILLAEFLKEEPYSTGEQDIGLRPWLVKLVGFQDTAEQLGMSSGPGLEMIGLKTERIGQSIVTAEISVWSGTDGQGGYAATMIFFLTLLAICLYVSLRETGIDHFLAGSGALLAVLLPALTRLSLNGFLSQVSILFVFPFFACLLQRQDLPARSFTLFFSLALAYVVAAYSEIAPLGFCALLLGVTFVRRDKFRSKRLMLMSSILLIALVNPFYLRNLIEFLGQQYYLAANMTSLNHLAPNVLTLRGWSELIFGSFTTEPFALLLDCGVILLGLLVLAGAILLSRRDRLTFGAILLPAILVIAYLATRTPPSYYPIAKITLSILPFVIGLVFVALFKIAADKLDPPLGVLKKLFSVIVVAAAASGSLRYYSEVLHNGDLLRYVREPRFQNVCRELEEIKNKRVLVFETHPWLAPWLCFHARHNDVYYNGRFISDSDSPHLDPLSSIPDLANVDFVATRDRLVDLRAPGVSCLTLVNDTSGEDRADGHVRYWLGPPARLRFLALRPISANLQMRLAPAPDATTSPIDYFLTDQHGHVFQGEIRGKTVANRRINFPRGLSTLELSVQAKESNPNLTPALPRLVELDDLDISDIASNPGG
jgi:hypothetical protein